MTYTLVLLRHGESDWNAKNLFTGWVDVDLSDKGRAEAVRGRRAAGRRAGLLPDVVHTSVLRRAITTANLALDAADRHWIPVRRHWRLNERHYGDLQGKDKKQTLEQFGEEQFMLWRRSYDVPPPPIAADNEYSQAGDPRYAGLGADDAGDRVPQGRRRADDALLGERDPGRTCATARRFSSPRTATRCAPSSSTSTGSATTTSPGSTSRPACRCVYELDDDFRPVDARRSLPRPGGGRRGRRRRSPTRAAERAGRALQSATRESSLLLVVELAAGRSSLRYSPVTR